MKQPDINVYVRVMQEIKLRTEVIHSLTARYRAAQIESVYLQIRMILELIALASIAANKPLFEENRRKFSKHWNLSDILKDIEKLNPGYYPHPVLETGCDDGFAKCTITPRSSGYLTKSEMISIHGQTGNVLHARNPYGKELDYKRLEEDIPVILEKIRYLLQSHEIQLLGNPDVFYLIHMHEPRDGHVHFYTFKRVERPAKVSPVQGQQLP